MAAHAKYTPEQRREFLKNGRGLPKATVRMHPDTLKEVAAAGGSPWVRRLVEAALALRAAEARGIYDDADAMALIEAALAMPAAGSDARDEEVDTKTTKEKK